MGHVTVRLTEGAWQNLHRVSAECGLTVRAVFEAATHIYFSVGIEGGEGQFGDERYRKVFEAAGRVAARLDGEARRAQPSRRKVSLRIDDVVLVELKQLCRQWGGRSVNAVLATTFTPWGSGWGGPEDHDARSELFELILVEARRRDYERRVGHWPPTDVT